jgi:hypothetical protein
MKKTPFILVVSALTVFLVSIPADAHHAWQLDRSKMVTLTGTVTKFDFGNPHVFVYLQVKDNNGNLANWSAGGPSPNQLSRGGWSRDTVKPGDQITVAGYRNKDGSNVLRFENVTLASGQVLAGYAGNRFGGR